MITHGGINQDVYIVIEGNIPCTVHADADTVVALLHAGREHVDTAYVSAVDEPGRLDVYDGKSAQRRLLYNMPNGETITLMFFRDRSNKPSQIVRVLRREVIY